MENKKNPEELFKKLKEKLDLSPDKPLKLSPEEIEYLSAVILLELDKGKRLNTLSEMDEKYIESLRKVVKERILPFKDLYKKPSSESKIDKKV